MERGSRKRIVDGRAFDLTFVIIDTGEHDQTLIERLRAEARRLGIDPQLASDVVLARLAFLLPGNLRAGLVNEARDHGWDPAAFIGFTIRPMIDDSAHDCEECAERVRHMTERRKL